jgi:hypothetical protein
MIYNAKIERNDIRCRNILLCPNAYTGVLEHKSSQSCKTKLENTKTKKKKNKKKNSLPD